jgi:hypothetical protein
MMDKEAANDTLPEKTYPTANVLKIAMALQVRDFANDLVLVTIILSLANL